MMSHHDILELSITGLGVLVTGIFSFIIYKADKRSRKFEQNAIERDQHAAKPALNFVNNAGSWVLLNVGGSTANRIRFCEKTNTGWATPIIGYSIPNNFGILLYKIKAYGNEPIVEILTSGAALIATYEDSHQNKFMTVCSGDTNHVYESHQLEWDQSLYDHCEKDVKRSDELRIVSMEYLSNL
jgi:hypothetical protein